MTTAVPSVSKVGFRGRAKYVDVKLKCTREYVERGVIELKYVGTKEQMADILTKRLQTPMVTKFVEKVLSKKCERRSNFSQQALMGECVKLNIALILERSYVLTVRHYIASE